MLKKNVQDAINEQIKNELESAYLYLAMSAHFESAGLPGFARWMRVQWEEELAHGLKLFDAVHNQGGRVELRALAQPPGQFGSPLSVFQAVAEHERKVTGLIHRLYELAIKEGDYATQVELQWFIREQVEEEKTVTQLVDLLKIAGDNPAALLTVDRQLASRGRQG